MSSPENNEGFRLISKEKLESAMIAARLDAIRENQRFGLPMIVERDGRIVHVDPFEAEVELLKSYPELATMQPPHRGLSQAK